MLAKFCFTAIRVELSKLDHILVLGNPLFHPCITNGIVRGLVVVERDIGSSRRPGSRHGGASVLD